MEQEVNQMENRFEVFSNLPYQRGFHITFNNGYTVSVQFGRGNYGDGKTTAEIAAWDRNDKWYHSNVIRWESDDVRGYATPEEVAAFIHEVSQL
jgi:hypothetical protein